jgi:flagellar biosynthesis protein FlhG
LSGYLGRIKLWSIGGGKGGIGKSLVSLGLGISLSRLGKKVIMIDGDLGGANLHTLMGVRYPHVTLEHFMKGKVNRLEDVIIPTQVEDIGLICGADSIIGSANPTYSQKMRLLNQIEVLPAQYVLLDLGAGTAFNTLDFFNYSQIRIVLFTSQTTSLQNVYGFIKSAIYRKIARDMSKDQLVMDFLYQSEEDENSVSTISEHLAYLKEKSPQSHYQLIRLLEDYQLFLVVNMVKSNADLNAPDIISSVCNEFLTLRPEIMGHVAYDPALEAAVNRISQVPLSDKKGKAAGDLAQIALKILMESRLSGPVGSHKWQNWGITMNPRQSL